MYSKARRTFVKKSLKAFGTLVFIKPFLSFSIKKTFFKSPSWEELVELARWCPSVHNLQPHKLKIVSQELAELYYDPSRLLPIGDPNGIFVTVALGVFIEHLNIVSKTYNVKVDIIKLYAPVNINAKGLTRFAMLKMVPNDAIEPLESQLILKRRTSRLHYDHRPLSKNCISKLEKEADAFQHQFNYTMNKELIDEIIKLNQQTLFSDLESKADRNELDHLFRYSKEEAAEKKDGLWSHCMCFPGTLMKSVFHHYRFWDKGIAKKVLSSYYRKSFLGTTTICWIGGKFDNTSDWLYSGRLMARSWLIITKENGYIHPFGSLITNAESYKIINEKFTNPADGKKIWMIFRAGYSDEPARSFRLDTSEIIIK